MKTISIDFRFIHEQKPMNNRSQKARIKYNDKGYWAVLSNYVVQRYLAGPYERIEGAYLRYMFEMSLERTTDYRPWLSHTIQTIRRP